jgi:hypothetical protein
MNVAELPELGAYRPPSRAPSAAGQPAGARPQQAAQQQQQQQQYQRPARTPVLQPQGLAAPELACDVPVVAVGSVGDQFGDLLQHLLRLCRSADRWVPYVTDGSVVC